MNNNLKKIINYIKREQSKIIRKNFKYDSKDNVYEIAEKMKIVRDLNPFGWAILSYDMIIRIKKLNGTVLEIGAGNGFNSMLLKEAGIVVHPIDIYPGTSRVEKMNHIDGLKKYKPDIVFMCWTSNKSSFPYEVLRKFNGTIVYIGQDKGGVIANDKFFELLKKRMGLCI